MELRNVLRRRIVGMVSVAAGAMIFTAACGAGTSTTDPAVRGADGVPLDYSALSGTVRIDGSSTVFPIAEAIAEEFSKVSRVRANVGFSGTGGGFEKFCRGETEVSNASRPIKASELEKCADAGINDVVEIEVAIDALTVMVNPRNTWVTCMTTAELNFAFRNGGAILWSDIRPEWPSDRIIAYYPGTDSGTFDYFVESIIHGVDKESQHRGDGTASEDDNILAKGLENDLNAIGYFGFAYFLEAGQALNGVAVDGGDGCVDPTFQAALDGSYQPLSRSLYAYTRESLLRDRAEVLGYVYFLIENMQELVPDVGYITLPEDRYEAQAAKVTPFLP